jgi:hypothetical protein
MFILWLAVMAVVVSVATAYLVWRIDWFSQRWSERRDRLFVGGMTMLGGIVFSTILWWLGLLLISETGALVLGSIGGLIVVGVLLVWSIRSTHRRSNAGQGLAPTRPTPEGDRPTAPTPNPR